MFSGGFGLDATEAVGGGDFPHGHVLDILAWLVDKSLVIADIVGGTTRYRVQESIRAYAADRLRESAEEAATRDRHAAWYLALAETAEPRLRGSEQDEWMTRLDSELDNLRASIEWYRGSGRLAEELRLVAALAWYWHRSARFFEGHGQVRASIARSEGLATPERLRVLLGGGILCVAQGEYDAAARWLHAATVLAGTLGNRHGIAIARLWTVWEALFRRGPEAAEPHARFAYDVFRSGADPWHLGIAHVALGFIAVERAQIDVARAHFEDASAVFHNLGDHWGIASALTELARVADRQGSEDASRLAEDALAASRSARNSWQVIQVLGLMVEIARARRDLDRAVTLGEEVIGLGTEMGQLTNVAWVHRDLGHVALMRDDPDGASRHFDAAWAIFQERDYPLGMACSLIGSAAVAARRDRAGEAARILGRAQALFARFGGAPGPTDQAVADAVAADARRILGSHALVRALADGNGVDAPAQTD